MNAMLASLMFEDEFQITHVEMIKGIAGHGFYDTLKVPIIENTARECELTDRLREAMEKYPRSYAVLVKRHGVYVWGDTWIQAKTQFESYEYLFETAVKMRGMGIDCHVPPTTMHALMDWTDADGAGRRPGQAGKDSHRWGAIGLQTVQVHRLGHRGYRGAHIFRARGDVSVRTGTLGRVLARQRDVCGA
jgi:hypothetical protein